MIELESIENGEEVAQAARSKLYHILSESWKYPGVEFFELIQDGSFGSGLQELAEGLPYTLDLPMDKLDGALLRDMPRDDFEAEFIRVFDVGPGGPPCPLREGLYHGDKQPVMEELVRFYNHFGLTTTEGKENKLPDDIITEFEFMHYLTFKEIMARQRDEDPSPYQRAQRDFLERRLAKWMPQLCERLETFIERKYEKVNEKVLLFYSGLSQVSRDFTGSELDYLKERLR